MQLYTVDSIRDGSPMRVWDGYMGAGKEDLRGNIRAGIATLLQFFGRMHEGHTPLVDLK